MKHFHAVALAAIMTLATAGAAAQSALTVTGAWSRATPPGTTVGAAYLVIDNRGSRSDRLLSVSSPRATRVEVHATVHDGDTARMKRVDPLHVGARERIELAPGGMHLMLMGLDAPLREGEQVPLVLRFEVAGEVRAQARVFAPGEDVPAGDHSHHHGH
jgi:copper(I)-binding protein